MSDKVLLWIGPVSTADLGQYVPPGWSVRTHNNPPGGIGSSAFREWALSLGPDPLSRLAPGAKTIILASFSAGHGASDVILKRAADAHDARLSGYLGFDSYYTDDVNAPPKPGHLAWGDQAARDLRPMWLTTSTHPDGNDPSASECIIPLVRALRLRPVRPLRDMPDCDRSYARGGVRWFDYGARFSHRDHAKLLSLSALAAWHDGPPRASSSGLSPLALIPLVALAVKLWRRR